jgi:hypothetical protein
MLWRKFKLNWSYAIGELAIVTLGVLVALAINQWNDDRVAQTEEKAILDRLLVDLNQDAQLFGFFRDRLTNKRSSLERLRIVFESASESPDATAVIQDVIIGAGLGWNQPGAQDITFREVVSSGKFGLMRSTILRDNISSYYFTFDNASNRIDARETEFPRLSYQLIPRSRETGGDTVLLSPADDISGEEARRLTQNIMASPIRNYVIAELNFAIFLTTVTSDLQDRNQALTKKIGAYRASLD